MALAPYSAGEKELRAAMAALSPASTNARRRASDTAPSVTRNSDGSVSGSVGKSLSADGKMLTVDLERPAPVMTASSSISASS